MPVRRRAVAAFLALLTTIVAGCSSGAAPTVRATRSYRLGFSAASPHPTVQSALATIDAWRSHADIAQITQTVPWRALLADTSATRLVQRDLQQLAQLYRSRGLPLIIQLDVTDGLAREREAPELVSLGRSIADPAVQQRYREYLLAVDSILRPDYLGLAMETNLVRAIAPANLYAALKAIVAAGAADLTAHRSQSHHFISVQVETAWGRLPKSAPFVGIATDRADFPFIDALGLSSYPFLGGFAEPEDVALDYYARLDPPGTDRLALLVVESGWSSASVPGATSSPDRQARWIKRQMAIADSAKLTAVTQITFTDLDLASYPVPPGSILPLFAQLGLVDTAFHAKPALAEWDRAMARTLTP